MMENDKILNKFQNIINENVKIKMMVDCQNRRISDLCCDVAADEFDMKNSYNKDYDRGAREAFRAVLRIIGADMEGDKRPPDSYEYDDLFEMFGTVSSYHIITKFSIEGILQRTADFDMKSKNQD